jgi:CRP/FNR family transcriptional regulator, cyclic AMP receptor protein
MTTKLDLSQIPLFDSFSEEARTRLMTLGRVQTFAAGAPLMVQGGVSTSLFVILEGRVRVARRQAPHDAPVALAEVGPGEVIGEMGMLDGAPRPATATALEKVRALEVSYAALAVTLLQYPDDSAALLRTLGRRTDE